MRSDFKKEVKKSSSSSIKKKAMTKGELEEALIDNFVNLQKVLTNLSFKFDVLSKNISDLLNLFEISAKSFIKPDEEEHNDNSLNNKEFLEKIDQLLDQNKIIAKGLTLIEEKMNHRTNSSVISPSVYRRRINEDFDSRPRPSNL